MKIFIDAGHNHSGADIGAQGNGLKEQDVTYSIARRTGLALAGAGMDVKFSRPTQQENLGTTLQESLNKRVALANEWGADYFVSIHCNSGGGQGAESYCYATGGESERLAKAVQASLVASTGFVDRGVKTGNFAVLRNTKMPAVLVECGFIDNKKDAAMLATEAGRAKIASGIAKGVLLFGGFQQEEEEESEMIYNYIDQNMPEWARGTIQKLVDKGLLKGNEKGELGLNLTMLKVFVVNDRAGLYD